MDRVASWDSRAVPRYLDADCGDEARQALLREIRAIYRRQGRGQHCHVDFYRRFDPERLCFHAFPEDFSRSDLVFDDEGKLSTATRRPATDAIFVYRPQEGLLELHARGTAAVKAALFDAFARTVLGLDGLSQAPGMRPFDLSRLLDPEYRFQIGPDDPFEGVGVVGLKVALPGAMTVHASFSAPPGAPGDADVRGVAATAIRSQQPASRGAHVVSAKLRFRPRCGGRGRRRPLTCELALPSRCTLRDEPAERDAMRCLQRWGIYATTDAR